MTVQLSLLGLAVDSPLAVPTSRAYRPPSWPPPKDWVCIEGSDGNPVSRYGDHVWDFTPWHGKILTFNFGDGPQLNRRSPVIDPANAELLRQLVAWKIWGPRGVRAILSVMNFATQIRGVIQICSSNGILASDLWRHPAVIDQVARKLPASTYKNIVAELDRLRDARTFLGFELLDAIGIARLKMAQPDHFPGQTEYIPPRIWTSVVKRVAECISDYRGHKDQIEACFSFCLSAYEKNGCFDRKNGGGKHRSPFQALSNGGNGKRSHLTYLGPFVNTAQRFGIKDLLERWAGDVEERGIQIFTTYFQVVRHAATLDIAAFTLMRIDEVMSVRWNCFRWDKDPVFGRIPLIEAETTKTDTDDRGLWITSPSVEPAVHALQSIAKMRLTCAGRWSDKDNHELVTAVLEPWGVRNSCATQIGVRMAATCLGEVVRQYPLLFDLQQLTITPDDYAIAKAVCPSLDVEQFQIGKPWHLGWHQFRRTGAVNMFASGEISDSSIQLQMKHLSRLMSLYYGRGNSTLRLNDKARELLVNAQYEAMSRQLAEVHSGRFVSPYGEEHKAKLLAPANGGEPVNLLDEADVRAYETAARKQKINFRQTALGACLKTTACDGDCVSSIGDCAGGNGKSPCATILFDRNRAEANQIRLNGVMAQLAATPPDTPRYRFLEQEKRGLENYFAYI